MSDSSGLHATTLGSRCTPHEPVQDERQRRPVGAAAPGHGVRPQPHVRVAHRVDSLDLVQDLIRAGLGVALLPADQPPRPGVTLLPLRDPDVRLRSYAVTRRGRADWPPLALVLDRLRDRAQVGGS